MPTSPAPDLKKPEAENKPPADKPIAAGTTSAKFLEGLIGSTPKPAAKPAKEPESEAGDKGGDEGEKPKPTPKKKAAPLPAPAIDEEKLGDAIGKSIAKHTAEAAPKPEKEKPAPAADQKEARKLAVFDRMEKLDSETYKGLADRYKESKAELRKYAADWEKANPGEKFDDSAEEHQETIAELEDKFDYDDEDYTMALAKIIAEDEIKAARSPRETELAERLTEVERRDKKQAMEREIAKVAYADGNEYWKQFGDDAEGVVDEKGQINVSALEAIKKADPLKGQVMEEAALACEGAAAALFMLANDLVAKGETAPYQNIAGEFALEKEAELLAKPKSDQLDDYGRPFVRSSQYSQMTDDEKRKCWTFSASDIWHLSRSGGIPKMMAKKAKAILAAEDEKFQRRARASGLISGGDEAEAGAEVRGTRTSKRRDQSTEDDDSDELDDNGKPQSPSFSLSPKTAGGKPGAGGSAKSGLERFVSPFVT